MRKGLSPLLATVLIISIAVVVASILAAWFPGLLSGETRTISNKTGVIVSCGIVSVQDVYLDFDSNVSRVFVRNSGPSEKLKSATLLTTKGIAIPNLTEFPLTVNQGQLATIEFNISGYITACANYSQVILSTEKCTSDKYDVRPKNC